MCRTKLTHEGLRFFCSEKEALFFKYQDTKGEISIAEDLYHIRHKTARLHLPSSEQVILKGASNSVVPCISPLNDGSLFISILLHNSEF